MLFLPEMILIKTPFLIPYKERFLTQIIKKIMIIFKKLLLVLGILIKVKEIYFLKEQDLEVRDKCN